MLIPGNAVANQVTEDQPAVFVIVGRLIDAQGQPVFEAHISANTIGSDVPFAETESQDDGSWSLGFEDLPQVDFEISIEHPHFHQEKITLNNLERDQLNDDGVYRLGTINMQRKITPAFWVATLVFVAVILLIATEKLHSTTAALAGFSVIFLVSYITQHC